MDSLDTSQRYVSALTVGELRRGAEKPRSVDRVYSVGLHAWIDQFKINYGERVLSIDARVAGIWGGITIGRSRPIIDTLIASTAIANGLVLVTRSVADMREIDVEIVNPWNSTDSR